MATSKKRKATEVSTKLSAKDFIAQFVVKQNELIVGMVECIKKGEIQLDDSTTTDDLIQSITDAWCEELDPSYMLQLQMCGSVFLSALLDKLYIETVNGGEGDVLDDSEMNFDEVANHPGVRLTLEVLKTIRSIWGKNG